MNGILKKEKARFPQKAGSPQKVISHQKAMSSQKTLGKDEGRFLKERGGEGRRRRWAKLWLRIRRNWVLYLFILPAFLYFLIFAYVWNPDRVQGFRCHKGICGQSLGRSHMEAFQDLFQLRVFHGRI